ncbi:hypothetical protein GUITHDRAFT_86895 [Guillardia theta CCMP2712]|uniref:tRNA/rRNA methyltransferase SpoU type domain-containing protein n=1 Tax=Guillardia theta (strain CCMP2712) TaxID=905079 RepID=L1JB20_GUITC|nr:hypothetical protein GUITHDRAFT_86895 [Guillardia theta CCMP2712]EKX45738.1 hypothetical protein GUITHDRAFT_86895 [Guillardia theta CCMP2712]|eukprot:XP_005832718.1 hypothetical protein GUITHDRAFT_86895 [Guillardia theta CCMP2712]
MHPIPEEESKDGHPLWLVLDEVMDPQNLGALLRSAYFLGADGVIVCSKNSAGLTPSVSKASAGAMELYQVYSVSNLMQFLNWSKELGWQVIGSALGENSVPVSSTKLTKPTLLVMGNEGRGLRTNVLRECDVLVQVQAIVASDLKDLGDDVLDSLNVSVAGGILIHHFLCAK